MRISVLCGGTRVFGLERIALMTAAGLRDHGHDLDFVISGWNDGRFPEELRKDGFDFQAIHLGKISKSVHPTALLHTADAIAHLPKALQRLRRHFSQRRPDVVLVHHRDWAILASSQLRRWPSFLYVHELGPPTAWTRLVYRAIDSTVAGFIAVSQHIADRLIRLGISQRRVHVVHNGVPVTEASPPRASDRTLTIGIVGQIGEWKGHEDLLDALALLKGAGCSFRCEIIGTGDSAFEQRLREKARLLGLDELIVWRGYVAGADRIFANIDICVVPSRFDDPFPVVALEASMRGKVLVVSNCGGLPEIVEDETSGLIVPPSQPSLLAAALERLLSSTELFDRVSAAARKRAITHFSTKHMTDALEAVLVDARLGSPHSAT